VLSLEHRATKAPIAQGSKVLLQALADLLLEAMGGEERKVIGREGTDEPKDHA
jgi:hypothetical protein